MKAFKKKYIAPAIMIAVGLYLLLKPSKGMAAEKSPAKPKAKPLSAGYDTYIVNTISSNLNIRKEPNTSSPIIGSLAKGKEVYATPTANTTNWHTLLDEDLKVKGYVSSAFLKKK